MAGFEIKKGWHVNIDATCIHYDPDLFKDPMQFNPSRFDVISSLPSSWFVVLAYITAMSFRHKIQVTNPCLFLQEMQKPYSHIPFGSGPRTCLGMNMAKVTMLVFLHRLTSGYKWVISHLPRFHPAFTSTENNIIPSLLCRWTVDDLDTCLEKKAHIPRLRSGCPITLEPLWGGN